MIVWLDPQPADGDVPRVMPSPFAEAPHAIAVRAARELMARVGPAEGKMFGVLVVRAAGGRVGYLRAFSGMLDGRWDVEGFVPPVFDAAARDAFWPAGEAELAGIDARVTEVDAALAPLRLEREAMEGRHAAMVQEMRERHAVRRAARHAEPRTPSLDQESRGDTAEKRRMKEPIAGERAAMAVRIEPLEREQAELIARRADRSRHYLAQIQDTYRFASVRGETKTLRELFDDSPPGGAGDCAAPKLLAYAYAHGLQPIALAEVWLGPAPLAGGRRAGAFYPACRGKCGPILAHVLAGAAEPTPVYASTPATERVVYEDAWIVVVDNPIGVLSVPGRGDALRDCIQARLRAVHPDATVVHRLDLDTSGLLVAAKDAATHAALQRGFARRDIAKTYAAVLDGEVRGDTGVIELALRVDIEDRPRQIHDPRHGKHALTSWRVVDRSGGRTRVALVPHTGRTHQLRVHAAHPLGLGAPVVGDRLYGTPGARLLLHAEDLAFDHPWSGVRISLRSPAPF